MSQCPNDIHEAMIVTFVSAKYLTALAGVYCILRQCLFAVVPALHMVGQHSPLHCYVAQNKPSAACCGQLYSPNNFSFFFKLKKKITFVLWCLSICALKMANWLIL